MPGDADNQALHLLQDCCRVELTDDDRKRLLGKVSDTSNWDRVVDLAIDHRVDGFLLKHLRSLDKANLLGEREERLSNRTKRSSMCNLALARELVQLLQQLSAVGIRAIPYKGPVLMQQVYGDVGLRATHDIDILIRPQDRDETERIVRERGFELMTEKSALGRWVQSRLEKDSEWYHPERELHLEVHWRFAKWYFPFSLDGRSFAEGLQEYDWAGHPFQLMPLEETLLTLCLHGSVHQWHRLEMLTMVAEYCRITTDLNWERLEQITTRGSGIRPLLLGLKLAHAHLNAPVPAKFLEQADADPVVQRLAQVVERNWMANQHHFSLLDTMNFELSLLASRRSRVRYLFGQFVIAVLRPFTLREQEAGKAAARPLDLARRHSLGPGAVCRLLSKVLHIR